MIDCSAAPEISLATLVAQLRESCQASARLYGGSTYYVEELAIFQAAAQAQRLFLDPAQIELTQPPTAEGNEHQVWFRESQATFLKATWPGHFGMKVVYRIPSAAMGRTIVARCITPDTTHPNQTHNRRVFFHPIRPKGAHYRSPGHRPGCSPPK